MKIIDDEPPIKSHPASKEYRSNWEATFGEDRGTCAPAPAFEREHEDKLGINWLCPCCGHTRIVMIDWREREFRCDRKRFNKPHSFDDIK